MSLQEGGTGADYHTEGDFIYTAYKQQNKHHGGQNRQTMNKREETKDRDRE